MNIFSREEMDRRVTAARAAMERFNLDAVVATSYPASYYLSGAPIHCFGRPMATLIPRPGRGGYGDLDYRAGHVAASIVDRGRAPLLGLQHHTRVHEPPTAVTVDGRALAGHDSERGV